MTQLNTINQNEAKISTINHNYYKWNIKLGDYRKDYESTEEYARKCLAKNRLKKITGVGLILSFTFAILMFLISWMK